MGKDFVIWCGLCEKPFKGEDFVLGVIYVKIHSKVNGTRNNRLRKQIREWNLNICNNGERSISNYRDEERMKRSSKKNLHK